MTRTTEFRTEHLARAVVKTPTTPAGGALTRTRGRGLPLAAWTGGAGFRARALPGLCTLALMLAPLALSSPARAQDQTLADIKQELSVLYVELRKLNRELSTTGAPATGLGGGTVLDRIDLIESELRRLTAKTEELEFRIGRIVTDGTNRIGDLEFRLCEATPGCDVGKLGDTPRLGGETAAPTPAVPPVPTAGTEMAMGEQADFDRALAALEAGDNQRATELFRAFSDTYTGGPLTGVAHFWRGTALEDLGRSTDAARAFLESFSGSPSGPKAPDALYRLGVALGKLGQSAEACVTLGEVPGRYPGTEAASLAVAARVNLACP